MAPSKMHMSAAMDIAVVVVVLVCLAALVPAAQADLLVEGSRLGPGARLTEGAYVFIMQLDCNLVLYNKRKSPQAIWASQTNGLGTNCYFILQSDGNGVVYTGDDKPVFNTATYGRNDGCHVIVLQSDGNCVMYNSRNVPIWATNTKGK